MCMILHIPIGMMHGSIAQGGICLVLSSFLLSYFGYDWADGDSRDHGVPIGGTLEFLIIVAQPIGLLIYLVRRYRLKAILAYAFYVSLVVVANLVIGIASLAMLHVRGG